ncbi:MAG: hypothetical protein L0Y57_04680 [Beijerinckiaceae bacterium]|nr:hypothetical protein [Beijerinckiaceae bacterium]
MINLFQNEPLGPWGADPGAGREARGRLPDMLQEPLVLSASMRAKAAIYRPEVDGLPAA